LENLELQVHTLKCHFWLILCLGVLLMSRVQDVCCHRSHEQSSWYAEEEAMRDRTVLPHHAASCR
jgi:hypothetical protein